MKDRELINRIKNGDALAFDQLFEKYYHLLVGYIRSLTMDLPVAEDIVQKVFMDIWAKKHKLNIKISVKGYLIKVCYNSYYDHFKKIKRREILLEKYKEETIRNYIVEDTDIIDNRVIRLRKLIQNLPPACKKVLQLSKFEGLSYDEIASELNVSKKTVQSQMRIAYQKIRQGFKDDNFILFFIRR